MPSTIDPAYSLTIANASSTPYTLQIMSWTALIAMPLVLAYQAWTYWVFRKRVTRKSIEGLRRTRETRRSETAALRGCREGLPRASALIGVIQTAVTIAFAWLLTDAITGAIAGRDVTSSLLWLLLAALLRGLLIAASDAAGTRAAAKTGMQLRSALVAAVGKLGPGWLAQRNQTELAVTAGHGLEALDAYFARYIPQLVLTVIATPVLVAVMWWQDWPSGLTAVITLPLIPIFLILIGMATRTVQTRQWQTLQRLAARFADTVQGLSTLRLFGRDRRAADRIEITADQYRPRDHEGAAVLVPVGLRDGAAGLDRRGSDRGVGGVPTSLR